MDRLYICSKSGQNNKIKVALARAKGLLERQLWVEGRGLGERFGFGLAGWYWRVGVGVGIEVGVGGLGWDWG